MNESKSQIYENFLPLLIAEPLYKYATEIQWSHGWKSNTNIMYSHWHHDITTTELCNGRDISNDLPTEVKAAWEFISATHLKDHTLIRCYANAHTFGVEGYPHTDSVRDYDTTVVLYMNKNWKREWGGETTIYDGNNITMAALPAFNRAMIFKANQFHCARAISRICPDLRRTIMFKCALKNADPKREDIQTFLDAIGATNKKHKKGSLTNHLLGTYDLLKSVGQPEYVCVAGATHSVLGTNIFTDACITDPAKLAELIGEEAFRLVDIFGKTTRPETIEAAMAINSTVLELTAGGNITISQDDFDALCALEAANLWDQNGNIPNQYPNLREFWFKQPRIK